MNRALAALLLVLCASAASAAEPYSVHLELPDFAARPAVPFMRFVRPDGRAVTYYATGDRYLESAFALLDGYWSPPPGHDPAAVRAHLKTFLPLELRTLRHEPAELLMRHFAESFFRTRDSRTKLVPSSTNGQLRSHLVYQAAATFQRWFPGDRDLLKKNVELAEAMLQYGDPCGGGAECGMYGALDVVSGKSRDRTARVQDYGLVGIMMTGVSAKSGDPRFAAWAARKHDFIWNERFSAPLPLLSDAYHPKGAVTSTREPVTSDTDTLYDVRRLFEMDALLRNPVYRDRAMAVTDLWLARAWNAQWGHFVRKLDRDGAPATDALYGDGMYNTLWVLIHAYEVTGEQRYLQRLREAYANLRMMGVDGLLPRHVRQGEMVAERGLAKNQAMFLEILLAAYEASGDSRFLCDAEQLADSILANPGRAMPDAATRGFAGGALLRLAAARHPIRRLDVRLAAPPAPLTIRSASGALLFSTVVPTEIATVYAPYGVIARCAGDVLCDSRDGGYAAPADPE
jgi:hypothetical protein